jgi:hypothetical protein
MGPKLAIPIQLSTGSLALSMLSLNIIIYHTLNGINIRELLLDCIIFLASFGTSILNFLITGPIGSISSLWSAFSGIDGIVVSVLVW